MDRAPKILVFDSGLGGLTVFSQLRLQRPDAAFVYCADDAAFPYGALTADALVARVNTVMAALLREFAPDVVVIACNTAATLVLPPLRASYPKLPFVGTVPAVKPAATLSRSRLISVLATPGTVARDYTAALIRDFAADCEVTLVGSSTLASLSEAFMRGEPVQDATIAAEIAPAFVAMHGRRTDQIVLACTHYPLLQEQFSRLAIWPVNWIDPAPAIARRADHLLRERGFEPAPSPVSQLGDGPLWSALFTSGAKPDTALEKALRIRGLRALEWFMNKQSADAPRQHQFGRPICQ